MEKMVAMWLYSVLLFFSVYTSVLSDVFDGFHHGIEKIDPCVAACDKTYPLHTYPKAKDSISCNRGCRFFSLNDFFDDNQDENVTKQLCEATCMDAYQETSDEYACKTGCSNMVPVAEKRRKELASEPASIHVVTPFMYVEDMFNNLIDQMNGAISVSWSYYMQTDNGKVIVIQSGPKLWQSIPEAKADIFNKNIETPRVLPIKVNKDAVIEDRSKIQNHQEHKTARNNVGNEDSDSADWLSCISIKFGIPRWLLAAVLFSSVLFIIWLCFVTSATAVPQPLHTQKLSLFGDMDDMDFSLPKEKEKVPLIDEKSPVPVHQAPPLPIKLKIESV